MGIHGGARVGILMAVLTPWNSALAAEEVGVFRKAPCPIPVPAGLVEGRDITCGYVVVPERHAQPTGRTLRLLLARVSSLSENPAGDPLVPLPTGPGSSSIDSFLPLMASPVGALLRARRDVVIFEQRGLFHSEKSLACSEVDEWFRDRLFEDGKGREEVKRTAEVFAACRQSLLKKDINLGAYRYTEAANDLVMVMSAMGYAKFNALGVSAGTMLGQHLLKEHPDRLRSVILNSVARIDVSLQARWPAYSAQHLQKLFAACASDQACNEAYPNLKEKLERIVRRLNLEPYKFKQENPRNGRQETAFINGDRFAETIFTSGYLTSALPGIPETIHSVDSGDETRLKAMGSGLAGPGPRFAWGLGYSVFCSEAPELKEKDITFAGLYPAYEEAVANGIWGPRAVMSVCGIWGVARMPDETRSLPTSDVPTLLMSGEFDSISPKESAAAVAQRLGRAYEVVVPGAAHSAIESGPCPISIALRFLDDPTKRPDDSCLAPLTIHFKVPGDSQSPRQDR